MNLLFKRSASFSYFCQSPETTASTFSRFTLPSLNTVLSISAGQFLNNRLQFHFDTEKNGASQKIQKLPLNINLPWFLLVLFIW